MIFLAFLACDRGPWTTENALAPSLARMDKDGDGRVTEAEYAPVSFAGPPWADVDLDASGDVDLRELAGLIQRQDPTTFYFSDPELPPPRMGGGKPDEERSHKVAVLRVFETLQAEVVARDPSVPVPTAGEMEEAAEPGTLDSAEALAMFARLEVASKAAGVTFPKALSRGPGTGR